MGKTTNCSCNSLGLGQKICSFFSPSFLILQWRGCLRQAKSALKSSAVEVMGGPTPHRAPHLPESPASITMSALLQNLLFHPLVAPDVPSLVAPSSGKKTKVEVNNFSTQVVAGTMYEFDLVLDHAEDSAAECGAPDGLREVCHMAVWEKVWEDFREVQWDRSTCIRPGSN